MSDRRDNIDLNSPSAMFATVLAELKAIRSETAARFDGQATTIKAEAIKTNGRVRALETWRAVLKGKLAVVSAGVSAAVAFVAWLIENLR
jgi:hypothetical protein